MRLRIILSYIFLALISIAGYPSDFVTVSGGEFMLRGEPYRFVGTNLWYGPITASKGEGGNRSRLTTELDSLQALGIDNLRILAGGEGNRTIDCHIEPNLQTAPGVYDENLLEGLDYLLAELERRDMRAVIYLNNSWEWSGGYGTYLEWSGHGEAPLPNRDGYQAYVSHVRKFMTDSVARSMYADHVRHLVTRISSITGKPYKDSPAIMSWQICNEPRCFDKANKELFYEWLTETGRLIKSLDSNHLVSTGSEGTYGCEVDIELWARIHNSDAIDYANIHIWPYNWRWVTAETLDSDIPIACANTAIYIARHRMLTKKPLVLEEFGYPRDSMEIAVGSSTDARDSYYRFVLGQLTENNQLNGINFWGWGGSATPAHRTWQPGDEYTADPAQEPQGLYSVFSSDISTKNVIRNAARSISR